MLKTNTTRSTITRYLLVTPLLLLLFAVFSCENGMAQQEEPSSTIKGEIFTEVDEVPSPQGGMTQFFHYVQENLKYPDEARNNGIEGKVFIEFVVDKSGKVHDAKILRGIGNGCDAEALRVIANSPDWNPGVNNGQVVNVKLVMPLTFKLD